MRFITPPVVLATAALALAVAAAPAARAEEAPTSPEIQAARDRFAQAVELVDQERFQEALDIFQELRQTNPHPVVTYNIAWCLSRLSRPSEAITTFEQYLSENDEDQDRLTRAHAELDRLRTIQAAENTTPPVEPPTGDGTEGVTGQTGDQTGDGAEQPEPTSSRRRLGPAAFYSLLGITGAAGIGLIVTGALALGYDSDAEDVVGTVPFDQNAYSDIETDFNRMSTIADVMLAVTCVAAAATLLVGIFTDFHRNRQAARRQAQLARAASLWW